MTREKLESYLGEYVEVTLFDDFAYKGILRKTEEKNRTLREAKLLFLRRRTRQHNI